jgi:acyl-CoA thioesterase FadM
VEFGYWMTRPEVPGPLCRARITSVAVDMDTMRKQPVPDKWRAAFAPWVIPAAEFPAGPAAGRAPEDA